MAGKKKKSNARLQIGGGVHVSDGDFVAGDKNVKVDKGGVFIAGNVQGSNIVTGHHNQAGNQEALFEELIKKIEQRSNTSTHDREDLKANVAEIQAEAKKGNQADESFLARRLRNIERIAPDIAEVMLTTLTNPVAGFASIVRKVAEQSRKSAGG